MKDRGIIFLKNGGVCPMDLLSENEPINQDRLYWNATPEAIKCIEEYYSGREGRRNLKINQKPKFRIGSYSR